MANNINYIIIENTKKITKSYSHMHTQTSDVTVIFMRKWTQRAVFKSWSRSICISILANVLEDGMKPSFLSQVMGK